MRGIALSGVAANKIVHSEYSVPTDFKLKIMKFLNKFFSKKPIKIDDYYSLSEKEKESIIEIIDNDGKIYKHAKETITYPYSKQHSESLKKRGLNLI